MNRVYALMITALFAVLTACSGGDGGQGATVPPIEPSTYTFTPPSDPGLSGETPGIIAPPTPLVGSCVVDGKPFSTGATVECPCKDGTKATQVCQKDGTLSACDCKVAGGSPPSQPPVVPVVPVPGDPNPPVCTSYTYSDWGECQSGGTQTRTVVTALPVGCKGTPDVLSQSCKAPAPTFCAPGGWVNCKKSSGEAGKYQCKADGSGFGECKTFCDDAIGSILCNFVKGVANYASEHPEEIECEIGTSPQIDCKTADGKAGKTTCQGNGYYAKCAVPTPPALVLKGSDVIDRVIFETGFALKPGKTMSKPVKLTLSLYSKDIKAGAPSAPAGESTECGDADVKDEGCIGSTVTSSVTTKADTFSITPQQLDPSTQSGSDVVVRKTIWMLPGGITLAMLGNTKMTITPDYDAFSNSVVGIQQLKVTVVKGDQKVVIFNDPHFACDWDGGGSCLVGLLNTNITKFFVKGELDDAPTASTCYESNMSGSGSAKAVDCPKNLMVGLPVFTTDILTGNYSAYVEAPVVLSIVGLSNQHTCQLPIMFTSPSGGVPGKVPTSEYFGYGPTGCKFSSYGNYNFQNFFTKVLGNFSVTPAAAKLEDLHVSLTPEGNKKPLEFKTLHIEVYQPASVQFALYGGSYVFNFDGTTSKKLLNPSDLAHTVPVGDLCFERYYYIPQSLRYSVNCVSPGPNLDEPFKNIPNSLVESLPKQPGEIDTVKLRLKWNIPKAQ